MAQDLAHFLFHRAAVLGGADAQLPFQLVVETNRLKFKQAAVLGIPCRWDSGWSVSGRLAERGGAVSAGGW
jgi:hypothetical protein